MSFLNPTYLWALIGLAIPIAIHLWSKKEGKTIKISSIKLLSEKDSKQSSSISLNELLLLLFRLSIITLIVLIMVEPQIKKESINASITYIIEPSLITNNGIASLIDSLQSNSSVRLLQNKFPELTENTLNKSKIEIPNYWQLAKEMEVLQTDSIVVFTNAFAKGLKGKRPSINKNTEWIIINNGKRLEEVIQVTKKEKSTELISLLSDDKSLYFKKESTTLGKLMLNKSKDSIQIASDNTQEWLQLKTETLRNILLFFDAQYSNESRYIEAGINAISQHLNHPIKINKTQDSENIDFSLYNNIVWLSNTPLPNKSSRALIYKPDIFASNIIIEGESKNEFHLTKSLNSENIIEKHLTEHLLSWLNLNPELEAKIASLDKRVASKAELIPVYNNQKTKSTFIETISITKWLLLLLALLLVTERIIAYLRKQ